MYHSKWLVQEIFLPVYACKFSCSTRCSDRLTKAAVNELAGKLLCTLEDQKENAKRMIHINAVFAVNKELCFSFHILNYSNRARQKKKGKKKNKKRRQGNNSLMKRDSTHLSSGPSYISKST